MPAPQIFFADLVRERCSAGGAGPLVLDGALPGHRGFAGTVPVGALFHYSIAGVSIPGEWETGTGRIAADGRLERLSVAASSAGGAPVVFSAGLKTVALTVGAGWFAGAGVPPGIADVSGLAAALDGKQPAGSYAAASHGHGIAAVSGLAAALDAKQPLSTQHGVATSSGAGDLVTVQRGAGWVNIAPRYLLQSDAGENEISATLTGGDFNLCLVNGANANGVGASKGRIGLFYANTSANEACAWEFRRGGSALDGSLAARTNGATRLVISAVGAVTPGADNAQSLGGAGARWSQLFAASGTISTSDARDKGDVGPVPEVWLDAWGAVEWQRYRMVGGKRWHVGLVAQAVAAAFAGFGIDAFAIGLICRDPVTGVRGRKDRWGLRYEECLALEAAWQRREIARLSARLSKRRIRKVAA